MVKATQSRALDDDLVMSLVELALARPPEERHGFIVTACGDDSELSAQVRKYVSWEERMNRFLLDPLFPPIEFEHRLEPGELLSRRFRISKQLGEGGMAVVYEAVDEKLDRRVAIKCAKSGFRKRLPPEVRHATRISHPNVCKIYEIHTASTSHGDIDFITMELLEGETLAARLRRERLPEDQAQRVARQICAGLAEAHRQGVVHGDLKSGNVIFAPDADGTERAVITDFGLARGPVVSAGLGGMGSLEGGTPDYMAPEIWKGEKASTGSDVYALGVVLCEVVAGRRPFGQEIPIEERLTRKPPSVHKKWDSVLARCLDPDVSQRFRDARAVAKALEPPIRRRFWLAAGAAMLLAIIASAVTYEREKQPKEEWRLALLPVQALSTDARGIAADLSPKIASQLARLKAGGTAHLSFVSSQRKDAPTHLLHVTVAKQDGKIVVHGTLSDQRRHVSLGDHDFVYKPDFEHYAPVALAGMVTASLNLPPLALPEVTSTAMEHYRRGVWNTRQNSTLEAALKDLESAVEEDPNSPFTFGALAEAGWFEYYFSRNAKWLDRTRDWLDQAESRDPDIPAAHRVEGYLRYKQGLYELAEPEFERAIALEPANAMAHIYLAKSLEDNDQLDRALAEYEKATQVEPRFFRTWQNLGAFHLQRGNISKGAEYHARALSLADDEPNLHWNLAVALTLLGHFEDARREISGQQTVSALTTYGITLMYDGHYAEAVKYLTRASEIKSPLGGVRSYSPLMYLGIAYRNLRMSELARKVNERGLKMADDEMVGAANPRDGYVESFQGYFGAALGDRRSATQIFQSWRLMPHDSDTRFRTVLAYEELFRQYGDREYRDKTFEVLNGDTPEQIDDLSRWDDLSDLRSDIRFKQLAMHH
jgi:serine/threonine protein kinase/Flp pilus assembly protein TadD